MALSKVMFRPGINSMVSPTLNEGGWSDASLVRFRQGLPERFGGWTRFGTARLRGRVRSLLAFTTLIGDSLLAAGSHDHLYVQRTSDTFDITPIDRALVVAIGDVRATAGSNDVLVVTATPHGLRGGDWVTFDTLVGQTRTASGVTVGGIVLADDFAVMDTPTTTTFLLDAPFAATATAASTAAVTVTAFLGSGPSDATPGLGWGAGGWGVSPWGGPAAVPAEDFAPRFWSLDAWGQTLLASPTDGALYVWSQDAVGNINARATRVVNATVPGDGPPRRIGNMLIASPERHLILLGASALNSAANYDAMLVRWSDVEDYTAFRASGTNSAGSFRLQSGNAIVGGYNAKGATLLWTDTALYIMRFVNLPYVYGFDKAGANCGLIASHAYAEVNGVVYWMGAHGFFRFQGGVPEMLPCTMLREVFGGMTQSQRRKVTAGVNPGAGEVLWFYPSDGEAEVNRYVAFNAQEGVWYGGKLARTAWLGTDVFANPLAVSPDGYVYEHEVGDDAAGEPMNDYIQSGFFDVADGQQMMFVSQLLPDFQRLTGAVTLTILKQDYPAGRVVTKGPYTVRPSTTRVAPRIRGRQMALRIESAENGTDWRLGAVRLDSQPDGQR